MKMLLFLIGGLYLSSAVLAEGRELDSIVTTSVATDGKSKTTFISDPSNQISTQVKQVYEDGRFQNTEKIETISDFNMTTTISYAFVDSRWMPMSKVIVEHTENGSEMSESVYTAGSDGHWMLLSHTSLTDLSQDNEMWNDVVFDANGNEVMVARYIWSDSNKVRGVGKKVCEYSESGLCEKQVNFEWVDDKWMEVSVSDYYYRDCDLAGNMMAE